MIVTVYQNDDWILSTQLNVDFTNNLWLSGHTEADGHDFDSQLRIVINLKRQNELIINFIVELSVIIIS